MNSVRYGLLKKILCNKMDKENAIPPIKPSLPNNISSFLVNTKNKNMKQKISKYMNKCT